MKLEEIDQVMNEVLEDLKTLKIQKESETKLLERLTEQVKNFDEKLASFKVTPAPTDLSGVENQIREGIVGLQSILEAKPKNITRTFHFHFFPKVNIMDYYRTYSKLILYMAILTVTAAVVIIGVRWIDGYNQRRQFQQTLVTEPHQIVIPQIENKRNKTHHPIPPIDTVQKKASGKIRTNIEDLRVKKLLLDSLHKEIINFLSKPKLDSLHK